MNFIQQIRSKCRQGGRGPKNFKKFADITYLEAPRLLAGRTSEPTIDLCRMAAEFCECRHIFTRWAPIGRKRRTDSKLPQKEGHRWDFHS